MFELDYSSHRLLVGSTLRPTVSEKLGPCLPCVGSRKRCEDALATFRLIPSEKIDKHV